MANWSGMKWIWQADRVTRRDYPAGGVLTHSGALKGSTSTDYFQFDCPKCGQHQPGLDTELLGVLDVSTIIIGLHCPECKMVDMVKIPCLESIDYQPRLI